jgi:hypothetical protein
MIFFNIFFLISLIKLLQSSNNPILCAGIYTSLSFILSLMFGKPFLAVLIGSAISFLLAWLYFWLLKKLDGSFFWWIVLLGGLLIGLV